MMGMTGWIVTATVLLAIAAAVIMLLKRAKESSKDAAALVSSGNSELDVMLREAEQKLTSSKLGSEARFRTLPVIFIMGPAGSTKTTTVLRSGLEPELLSGQVFQDGNVAPTPLVNVWYAQQTVFLEAGPKVQTDAGLWHRLIKHMQPGQLRSAFQKGEAAPRAAVVCYECESFLKSGATEAAAEAARQLRTGLVAISSTLGVKLSVYVLFTKLDRVAFFQDYVRGLNHEEAGQVLGVTLPIREKRAGVYGQQQSDRITQTFHELVYSLCDKRPEFLSRENDANALGAIYEFPREFRKLRAPMLQFLVELCRPTELTVGPFLRGFYFCGVRPVIVQEELAAEASQARAGRADAGAGDPGATRMFRHGENFPQAGRAAAAPAGRISSRKLPQWVFLNQLFGQVLLRDRAGLAASGVSIKTNFVRRLLLATAALLCLFLVLAVTYSFLQNRALERQVRDAANGIAGDAGGSKLPSLEALNHLEALRQALVQLTTYERHGAPTGLRWGLYTGSQLYPDTRRLYFDRFKALLFRDTQAALLNTLAKLPAAPGPRSDYSYAYNTLKSYLETTSNHEKATLDFLPPVLEEHWLGGRAIDPERAKLVRRQFDFYTSELMIENPYTSTNDTEAVANARKYLEQFGGAARVYQAMLAEANRANRSFNFNKLYPGSSEELENTREMAGAFSKPGFTFMDAAIRDPNKYASGEQWVLGNRGSAALDHSKLERDIRGLYFQDFVNQWRDYFRKSAVVKYKDLPDAAKKLAITASPQSPLLELFGLAAQNTAVDPEIAKAFKPLHTLMPPSNVDQNQYIGPSNTNYMAGLTNLQSAVDQASKLPPDQIEDAIKQANAAANSALLVARQTELGLGVEPEAHIEKALGTLLEEPITYILDLTPDRSGPINAAGAALCGQFRALFAKKPFQPNAKAAATLEEVNAIFRPQQGAMWVFYEQQLKKLLNKQGNTYAPVAGGKPALTGRFVTFFNHAAAFSNAVYASGPEPKLAFALKPEFVPELKSVQITIDGQSATMSQGAPAKQFTWPGEGVRMSANGQDYPSYDGLWGVFEFFYDADRPVPSPQWILRAGRSGKPVYFTGTNQPVVVNFDLDMLGSPQVFDKGYFSRLTCVAEVASK